MNRCTVVADAGPLHYLVLIDCANTLGVMFEQVLIPTAVQDELLHPNAPCKIRGWFSQAPPRVEVKAVHVPKPIHGLHRGETEALYLAIQARAAAVLLDDLDGRSAAKRLGLAVIGTIAILEHAAEKGLIELHAAISSLRQTNFFAPLDLLEAELRRDRDRRNQ